MVLIMVAGIPWAFNMHGRLSAIQAKLDALEVPPGWLSDKVADLETRVRVLELEGRQ